VVLKVDLELNGSNLFVLDFIRLGRQLNVCGMNKPVFPARV
jgi:hypothetical protein